MGLAAATAMALAWCGSAQAADSLIGTWQLDEKASKFSPLQPKETAPKGYTETYEWLPSGDIRLVMAAVIQGSKVSTQLQFPAGGGAVQIGEGPLRVPGRSYVEMQLGPNEWVMSQMMNGKQQETRRKVISADGKTRHDTVRGQDPQGRSWEIIEVFRRQ
jgi:hypothetical protein